MESGQFVEVTPHIAKLDLSLSGGAMPVGVWLVRDASDWSLIDTGSPKDAAVIEQAVVAYTNGQVPKQIILTHGHYDHAGSVALLQQRWGIPVLAHPAEVPLMTGEAGYGSVRPTWWGYQLLQIIAALGGRVTPVSVATTLADGDAIAGMDVRHVPGHTPGMIALIHRADRAIIAGDTFISKAGRLTPPIAFFTPDRRAAIRSMAKLAYEDFDHLLASHGRPILHSGRQEAERAARVAASKT